jgi:hypothetical protein
MEFAGGRRYGRRSVQRKNTMPKNPEERIDTLEKAVRNYKILSITMLVLVLVIQRDRIKGWLDRMEHWMSSVSSKA